MQTSPLGLCAKCKKTDLADVAEERVLARFTCAQDLSFAALLIPTVLIGAAYSEEPLHPKRWSREAYSSILCCSGPFSFPATSPAHTHIQYINININKCKYTVAVPTGNVSSVI